MTHYQPEDRVRLRRTRSEQAIALAMQNRWEEAVQANSSILEVFPTDVDALNRLGRALTELGHYADAYEAYSRALKVDPNSAIAKKNVARLTVLKETQAPPTAGHDKVDPRIFIEETGKTGITVLTHLGLPEVLAKMSAGEQVNLTIAGRDMAIENANGEYLGKLEPKLGLRLVNLMKGGNKYSAAITNLTEHSVRIIIKETLQHPSQAGRVSFPTKGADGFRSYTKDTLLTKYELDDDTDDDDGDGHSEWEEEPEVATDDIHTLDEEPPVEDREDDFRD
ncbi:MAG: tetratricopeptide repeat protein [Dehalococcoidia bacterium]|nr:tetratricopeptide repeat protein [Dehalococcoidia bacterium]